MEAWKGVESGLNAAFGSIDERYDYHIPPQPDSVEIWEGIAWRGERINIQLLLWSSNPLINIRLEAESLKIEKRNAISKDCLKLYPVRYVITDVYSKGCGFRNKDTIPSHLVADMLEQNQMFNLESNSVRPVWLTIDVPAETEPGNYMGSVSVLVNGKQTHNFPIQLTVSKYILPPERDPV